MSIIVHLRNSKVANRWNPIELPVVFYGLCTSFSLKRWPFKSTSRNLIVVLQENFSQFKRSIGSQTVWAFPVSLTKTVRVINWWSGSRRWRFSTNILGVPCHKRIIDRTKASDWTSESELFLFLDARWRAYKSLQALSNVLFQVSFYNNFPMFSSLLNFFENSCWILNFLNLSNRLFEFSSSLLFPTFLSNSPEIFSETIL